MNIIKGSWNRIWFLPVRLRLKRCGKGTFFESFFNIEGAGFISLGSHVRAKPRLHIAAISRHNNKSYSPEIVIGNDVSINYDVHIASINKIVIGDGTLIASKVFITDHMHGQADSKEALELPPSSRPLHSKGPVIIENNVWVGEGCCILPGVRIGRNSIIGANAVVTKDVPAYSVVGGVPAEIIRNVEEKVGL